MTYRSSRPLGGAAALALLSALAAPAARAQEPSNLPADPRPDRGSRVSQAPLPAPDCLAASAILVDAATGTVLWQKNSHVRRPIASTTKIMTTALALESGRLDDVVTFSDHARETPYANLNAKPGERFKLRDLLYAMMLRSSNDSCVAVAEHLAGEAWRYAARMTEEAHALGANDTNFVTVNGLYDPQHYSTAYDLALLTRHAIQNPVFNEIVSAKFRTISRSINWKDTLLKNHNKFLSRYDGADGIKTGYVHESGKCLVASSTRFEGGQPWRLITVVLKSPDTYGDSARLQNWGRKYFQPVFFARRGEQVGSASVNSGTEPSVPLVVADDLRLIVRRHAGSAPEREVRARQGIQAPVRADRAAGKLVALVDGRPVGEVELRPEHAVGQVWTASMAPWTPWPMLCAAVLFLVPRYARAFAKGARRRRSRLATGGGGLDRGRESHG